MRKVRQAFYRFLRDESGQSTTEYILILAVVVMIALQFRKTIKGKIEDLTRDVTGKMDEFIQNDQ